MPDSPSTPSISKVTEALARMQLEERVGGHGHGVLRQATLSGDTAAEASVHLLQAPKLTETHRPLPLRLCTGLFIYPSRTIRTFTA